MKNSIIKFSVAVSIALQPAVLYAGSTGVESTASPSNTSVKDSADKSKGANSGAQAQQIISAGMMFAMAAMQRPPCVAGGPGSGAACAMMAAMIGMGVLSLAQSKEHASAADSAGYTSGLTDGLGKNPYDYSNIDIKDPNNPANSDPNVRALGSNLKKLSDIVDAKGNIKTPDGKKYKASDFSSQSAMAAAGVPNGAALGAMAAYDAVQKKAAAKVEKLKIGASTEAMGFDDGGGSGASSTASSSDSGGGYAAAAAPVGVVRDPSSLAGMQKNYNGEPIGVAADSIFLMMNRRYKVKESQESFFNESDLLLQK
ncbi:MAG: hypothetical protein HUU57_00490 [Bdellovibrio sp.]|nr:hypothetical protein [Bdellovibrio sp.]